MRPLQIRWAKTLSPTGHQRRKPTIVAVIHAGFPYSSRVATSCIGGSPSFGVNVIHIYIDAVPWQAGQGRALKIWCGWRHSMSRDYCQGILTVPGPDSLRFWGLSAGAKLGQLHDDRVA